MVILKEAERQHDEAQNNQGTTTPGSGMKNSVPGAGAALGQNETVTYTNEGA